MRSRVLIPLTGNAVRQVIDHVQPRDVLLIQVIDRVGVFFAEDRDQNVGAGDFFPARRLHVIDRALQHPLEPQRGLRIALYIVGEHRDRGCNRLLQIAAQPGEIGATGFQDDLSRGIVQEGQQQMFDRHVLMPRLTGALVALADAVFEILAKHEQISPRTYCDPTWGRQALFHSNGTSLGLALCRSDPSTWLVHRLLFRPAPWCTSTGAGDGGRTH